MLKRVLHWAWVALLVALPLTGFTATSTWKIASLEWPPYASEHMDNGGDAIASLRDLLAPHDIAIEVDYLPWEQAQLRAAAGEYVGYFPAWPSEVRSGFIASAPLGFSHLGILGKSDNDLDYRNLIHLFEQYKVGVVASYVYPTNIQNVLDAYGETLHYASSERELVNMLNRGSVDLILASPEVVGHFSPSKRAKKLKMVTQFADIPLVLALKQNDTNRARKGFLDDLLQRHLHSNTAFTRPTHLVGTYINTPGVEPFIHFIEQIYAELGISLKLEAVPARRGLVLLNAGLSDLDVVRVAANMARFKNVRVVEPTLALGEHILLCDKAVPCNLAALSKPSNKILVTRGALESLTNFDIKAKLMFNEKLRRTPELLKRYEFEYAIFSTVFGDGQQYANDFNILPLRRFRLNHVVNRRLDPLVPELQRTIQAKLDDFTPNSVH
ncbi:hypothetical protein [Pseudoalteromonas sp. T1lg88]|uniref:hypothetical protein n=1 Tax=Pseudoalteromonas sp. T1lg88 TaxID=2077104 RepID=UPI000CF6CF44|nr:hypothetical protein [Pseudoalteromonas sp. T1lg88]